jgi:hypothetical protein
MFAEEKLFKEFNIPCEAPMKKLRGAPDSIAAP